MIELKHISVQNQNAEPILQAINLTIQTGEIFGIIGKSGAGKSTLLRCLNKLVTPSSGHIYLDNEDLCALPAPLLRQRRQRIGMIFQDFNLVQRKSVCANIALPLQCHTRLSGTQLTERVEALADLVGIKNYLHRTPSQLSGGQQQRVAIARALALNPDLLLCDEATSALDPETTTAILSLIKQLSQELKLTVVMVTHEMSVLKSIADRVAVIDKGQLLEVKHPLALTLEPESNVAKALLRQRMQQHVPASLLESLRPEACGCEKVLLSLSFIERYTTEAIIATLAAQFGIKANILQADIEYINAISVGHMLIELPNDDATLQQAHAYFVENRVTVAVLGYV